MSVPVLVADDEPLLREALALQLAEAWPEAQVVASARNGREALELFERHQPAVCFLDVQMPGLSGIDVARRIGARAHLVFVTAYDRYAVEAFAAGDAAESGCGVHQRRFATRADERRSRHATVIRGGYETLRVCSSSTR